MGDLGEGGRGWDRYGLGFSQFSYKRESNGTKNDNWDFIVPEILCTAFPRSPHKAVVPSSPQALS